MAKVSTGTLLQSLYKAAQDKWGGGGDHLASNAFLATQPGVEQLRTFASQNGINTTAKNIFSELQPQQISDLTALIQGKQPGTKVTLSPKEIAGSPEFSAQYGTDTKGNAITLEPGKTNKSSTQPNQQNPLDVLMQTPVPQQTSTNPSLHEGGSYVVQPGDTLGAIAKKMGVPMASITGYRSGNPNLIYPGEKLQIAGTAIMGSGNVQGGNPDQAQLQNIQKQIQDKQQQAKALQDFGLTDTKQLGKDTSGSYVPKEQSVAPAKTPKAPTDFIQTYTDTLSKLGIPSIKQQFEDVQKKFGDLQNELNGKIADINDNPWMVQGIKDRNIEQIKKRYEGKLDILTNQMKIYDSLYQEGIAQAKFLTTGEIEQQQNMIEAAQKKLDAENKIKEGIINGSYKNIKEVNGGLYDLENNVWIVDPKPSGNDGLSPAQINATVNQIVGTFDNEQIVKNYNTAQEGYQTIKSIGVNTKSPADDIAFIYAFAKIMDPNSVVREGEYNTIQRYAQTWADNFGFNAKRVFSNTNFLTADAKQKMLNALSPKINTLQSQYDNLYGEYQRRIEEAKKGQFNSITDYSKPFTGSSNNQETNFNWK